MRQCLPFVPVVFMFRLTAFSRSSLQACRCRSMFGSLAEAAADRDPTDFRAQSASECADPARQSRFPAVGKLQQCPDMGLRKLRLRLMESCPSTQALFQPRVPKAESPPRSKATVPNGCRRTRVLRKAKEVLKSSRTALGPHEILTWGAAEVLIQVLLDIASVNIGCYRFCRCLFFRVLFAMIFSGALASARQTFLAGQPVSADTRCYSRARWLKGMLRTGGDWGVRIGFWGGWV